MLNVDIKYHFKNVLLFLICIYELEKGIPKFKLVLLRIQMPRFYQHTTMSILPWLIRMVFKVTRVANYFFKYILILNGV